MIPNPVVPRIPEKPGLKREPNKPVNAKTNKGSRRIIAE
jgi:hypothetical protein